MGLRGGLPGTALNCGGGGNRTRNKAEAKPSALLRRCPLKRTLLCVRALPEPVSLVQERGYLTAGICIDMYIHGDET
jgi:hypothetical protein